MWIIQTYFIIGLLFGALCEYVLFSEISLKDKENEMGREIMRETPLIRGGMLMLQILTWPMWIAMCIYNSKKNEA